MLARESTATMMPPSKMKLSVVVPCAGFTISMTSRSKESTCKWRGLANCEHRVVQASWQTHVSGLWRGV